MKTTLVRMKNNEVRIDRKLIRFTKIIDLSF
jgi:hypothetical protein